MVDLDVRALHALRQPANDVAGFGLDGIQLGDVIDPRLRLGRVAERKTRSGETSPRLSTGRCRDWERPSRSGRISLAPRSSGRWGRAEFGHDLPDIKHLRHLLEMSIDAALGHAPGCVALARGARSGDRDSYADEDKRIMAAVARLVIELVAPTKTSNVVTEVAPSRVPPRGTKSDVLCD